MCDFRVEEKTSSGGPVGLARLQSDAITNKSVCGISVE